MLAKTIFNLGVRLRNPSLWSTFEQLKKSEKFTVDELEELQLTKLKHLLKVAKKESTFYKTSLDHIDVDRDICNLKDIVKLPLLTKETVLNSSEDIQLRRLKGKHFKAKTSGSTGRPLVFYRNESADSFNRAAIIRGYSWYKVNPWDKNGYFWGFNFSAITKFKTKLLDRIQNRFRLFSYKPSELEQFSKKINSAVYIHGYSSMIYQLAKYQMTHNIAPPKHLKLVKGTSEKIWPEYQQAIKQAFNVPMISEYGAAESGIIAFECPGGHMHITMEGVIVEEVDEEILVTNLELTSFPLIRYRLGDYIKLAPKNKTCSCGMSHRILEEVTGRIGQTIYGLKSQYPSLYFYYVFKNLGNQGHYFNYQILQKKKGHLEVLIEQTVNSNQLELIYSEMDKYFEEDMTYDLKDGAVLLRENGKLKSFISYL